MSSDCEESIGRLISLTSQTMRNHLNQRLHEYDLTIEQLQILKLLDTVDGLSQVVLGGSAEKTPANTTRILDRLEKKKRIVRRPNPNDRRSSLVFLCERGKLIRDELISKLEELQGELVEGIEKEKQLITIEVLREIRINLEKRFEKRVWHE